MVVAFFYSSIFLRALKQGKNSWLLSCWCRFLREHYDRHVYISGDRRIAFRYHGTKTLDGYRFSRGSADMKEQCDHGLRVSSASKKRKTKLKKTSIFMRWQPRSDRNVNYLKRMMWMQRYVSEVRVSHSDNKESCSSSQNLNLKYFSKYDSNILSQLDQLGRHSFEQPCHPFYLLFDNMQTCQLPRYTIFQQK